MTPNLTIGELGLGDQIPLGCVVYLTWCLVDMGGAVPQIRKQLVTHRKLARRSNAQIAGS